MRLLVALIAPLLVVLLIAALPQPGLAQAPVTSAEEVARLSDQEVRRLLLERLVAEDGEAKTQAPFNPAFTAYTNSH